MKKERESPPRLSRGQLFSLLAIIGLSFFLNNWGNQFPVGYHFDEPKKVRFIKTWQQDFHHPVLMLEIVRAANLALQLEDDFAIAVLGRSLMALVGTTLVAMVFLLARRELGIGTALLAALLTAVTPTLVLHAHYLKEDMLLTLFSLLTVGIFADYLRRRSGWAAVMTGLPLGLAFASHYKSLLLLPTMGIFVLLFRFRETPRHVLLLGLSTVVGLAVFLLVNSVILDDPEVFWKGFHHERNHALSGHTVPIYWDHFGMGYHLLYSVIPGLTWPLALFSIAACLFYAVHCQRLGDLEKTLLLFGVISYGVPEISPTKPPPDDCRYVLPLIPVLIWFAAKAAGDLWRTFGNRGARLALGAAGGGMLAFALFDSLLLDYYLTRDTRDRAQAYVRAEGLAAEFEPMAGPGIEGPWGFRANLDVLRSRGVTHFLISSFGYEQFRLGVRLDRQPPHVARFHQRYQTLLELPAVEFRPAHRQFGFSNPTVVVLDIREDENREPAPGTHAASASGDGFASGDH